MGKDKEKLHLCHLLITFIFFLLFSFNNLKACSCACVYFCDYAESMETGLIVYGEVIEKVSYSNDNQAIYLNILHKFRGGDITDIIKIYTSDGKLIQIKENFPLNEPVGNLPFLSSGVYYLEILWKKKRMIKKIISREI